jgi:Ca2+-binding RTX toxin-like protein/methionine-rich copper-binding protein CopC
METNLSSDLIVKENPTGVVNPTANKTIAENINKSVVFNSSSSSVSGATPKTTAATIVPQEVLPIFTNPANITIPAVGSATPYPSTINVSGVSGNIANIEVSLSGLSHSFPDDVDMFLLGPGGQKVMLMSDAGSNGGVNNINLTFSDSASGPLPDSSPITAAGSYLPTDYAVGDLFADPAPAGPYGTALSAFKGTNPNGDWQLFVQDDTSGDSGAIASGWGLTITTDTVSIPATDTGWYDNSGTHNPNNINYVAGDLEGVVMRNWMTFSLPTFTAPVASAQLQIKTYEYKSADTNETYELRDVTTPVSDLTAGGSGLTSIYNDLGDGTVYGSRDFTSADQNQTVTIDLNSDLVSAINAKSGQAFALGGQISTLDTTGNQQSVYGYSGGGPAADVQLLVTYDETAPTASTFTPADDATGVAVGADLVVNFSEAIKKGTTGDIVIKKVSDDSPVATIPVTDAQVTVSGSTVTINPTADLAGGTDYYVEIAKGAIKDIPGNDYAGITGNSTWNFKTEVVAPANDNFADAIVLSGVPVSTTGTNVGSTGEVGEPAQQGTLNSVWWSWTAPSSGTFQVDTEGSTFDTYLSVFTGNAVDNLTKIGSDDDGGAGTTSLLNVNATAGTTYQIAVDGSGGEIGPIKLNIDLAPDTTPPTASTFTPADNATGVAVGADLVVNFSEAIQKGTGDIVIKKVSDDSVVETIAVTATNVTVSGSTLTINPTANFAEGIDYYVQVANGAIKDIAGNNYAGIADNSTWNFQAAGTAPINGTPGPDSLTGTPNADIINGLAGNDNINGLAGNDIIDGGADNDVLDGGLGNDQLKGGLGNDTFVIDSAGDVVTELAGEGTDLVNSSLTYTLGANVENLTLTGTGAINGTGNTLANTITGNTANNVLNGGAGNDQLKGGAGNDIYFVDSTGDVVTEVASAGTDVIYSSVTYTLPANVEHLTLTGTGAINGTGNTLANGLLGNAGNNVLNGGAGNDQLKGGAGNDIYFVDTTGDVVTELASAGTDLINSSVTYTLPANVENLTLTGTGAINGIGNTLPNTITGNVGNNILNGAVGNDQLKGGAGNDIYYVDSTGDVVTEVAGAGTDLINSSVTYTLPANVENLTLTGTGAINGTGNTLANKITGNGGNNILNGAVGTDILTGGAGADTFVFQFGQSSVSAPDTITAFAIGSDKIDLLTQAGAVMGAPSAFSRAANNTTATTLPTLVTGVFADANGALTGNQALGINSAALVVATNAAIAGTYLIINDATAGFQVGNDLVVKLTGAVGTLPALGTIPVSGFFV